MSSQADTGHSVVERSRQAPVLRGFNAVKDEPRHVGSQGCEAAAARLREAVKLLLVPAMLNLVKLALLTFIFVTSCGKIRNNFPH
jgi:hypothetical protein